MALSCLKHILIIAMLMSCSSSSQRPPQGAGEASAPQQADADANLSQQDFLMKMLGLSMEYRPTVNACCARNGVAVGTPVDIVAAFSSEGKLAEVQVVSPKESSPSLLQCLEDGLRAASLPPRTEGAPHHLNWHFSVK